MAKDALDDDVIDASNKRHSTNEGVSTAAAADALQAKDR